MTINRVVRDRHPARSARILSTGIALSATLGLTSLYALVARAEQTQDPNIAPPQGVRTDLLQSLATRPLIAPSNPTPATPVTTVSLGQTPTVMPAPTLSAEATAPETVPPVIAAIPVQVIQPVWTSPKTSGSN